MPCGSLTWLPCISEILVAGMMVAGGPPKQQLTTCELFALCIFLLVVLYFLFCGLRDGGAFQQIRGPWAHSNWGFPKAKNSVRQYLVAVESLTVLTASFKIFKRLGLWPSTQWTNTSKSRKQRHNIHTKVQMDSSSITQATSTHHQASLQTSTPWPVRAP